MMIGSGADIILEVAQARNPARYAQAIRKLSNGEVPNLSQTANATLGGPSFQHILRSANIHGANPQGLLPQGLNSQGLNSQGPGGQSVQKVAGGARTKTEEAFRQLEQLTLQKALEIMIPDSISGTKSTAAGGQFWKAKLAEVLAKSISDSNQVGIASVLHTAFVRSRTVTET